MAITLVEAMTGSNINAIGNTFALDTYANEYFTNRPNGEAWAALADEQKKRLLLFAMNPFAILGWIGGLVDQAQPLSWPRIAIRPLERTPPTGSGYGVQYYAAGLYDFQKHFWPATAIPTPIKNAQCEQAFAISKSVEWTSATAYRRRIIQNSNGLIEFGPNGDLGLICKTARLLLAPFLLTGAGMTSIYRG